MQLTSADICFDRQVKTKDEALQRVVAALTHAGHTRQTIYKACASARGKSAPIWATALPFPTVRRTVATQCLKRALRCWLVRRGLTGVRSKPPI